MSQAVVSAIESPDLRLLRKVLADAVGTFALVFAGCGAVVVDAQTGALGHLGVSLVFGLVVGVMVFATGHVSGAHFNPAVTLAFAGIGRFPWREVPAYILGQVIAAICAGALVYGLIGDAANLGATLPSVPIGSAVALEVVLTFFLMFVITSVATDARAVGQMAGLAIGGTVALGAIFGGPISGASMNPARSLGPALVTMQLADVWIYLVGPIAGALLGSFTYRWARCDDDPGAANGCC